MLPTTSDNISDAAALSFAEPSAPSLFNATVDFLLLIFVTSGTKSWKIGMTFAKISLATFKPSIAVYFFTTNFLPSISMFFVTTLASML